MSTQEIYHYLKVNDQLIAGGQPTPDQLKSAADEGFTRVINLATSSPRYSLEDETGLVRSLSHCAANFRVTAFYGLYAMKHLGWSEAQADEFRASIWRGSEYLVWEQFITHMKAQIAR